jgi:predicted CoA-binding protein
MKKVVVIGASPKEWRYSYKAVRMLSDYDYEVIALGRTREKIESTVIQTGKPEIDNIFTISLYLNIENSTKIMDYILSLKPQRIVINPGAENPQLEMEAQDKGIEVIRGCTLVMLSTGTFEKETSTNKV